MKNTRIRSVRTVLGCVLWGLLLTLPCAAQEPVTAPGDVWLGVYLTDEVDGGIRVVAVVPAGPAAAAGLRAGDLLLEANGVPIADQAALERLLALNGIEALQLSGLRRGRPLRALLAPVELRAAPARPFAVQPWPTRTLGTLRGPLSMGLWAVDMTAELRTHYGAAPDRGLLVVRVEDDSPASRAGIRVGDVLVTLGAAALSDTEVMTLGLRSWNGRAPIELTLVRERRTLELSLSAPSAPPALPASVPLPSSRVAELERMIRRLEARLAEFRDELERLRPQPAASPAEQ